MDNCNRNYYEQALSIRACKLAAAPEALALAAQLKAAKPVGRKAAVVGGGPAGLAAAGLLARRGWQVAVFEREADFGGLVRRVIPAFRIADEMIDADLALLKSWGVELKPNHKVEDIGALLRNHDAVLLAIGAEQPGRLKLKSGQAMNALDFLAACKSGSMLPPGKQIVVAGGGNSAVDAARAALRLPGVERVSIAYRRDLRQMPAAEEELKLAQAEGVRFLPLLQPLSLSGGQLSCGRMRLGPADSSGRPAPQATGESVCLPCDLLIAAVGEQVDSEFYTANRIRLDGSGLPQLAADHESSRDNLYIIGDGAYGPGSVAQAIGQALAAVEAISGRKFEACAAENRAYHGLAARGRLIPPAELPAAPIEGEAEGKCSAAPFPADKAGSAAEAARCLECAGLCALCVETCPNRANRLLEINGAQQVLHIDALCNECGNCVQFCPYEGRPWRDKLTLFADERSFRASENQGFAILPDKRYLLRNRGICSEFRWAEDNPPSLNELVAALQEYCR